MRLEEFFARSLLSSIPDSRCKATCRECESETTLDAAEIVEDGPTATVYRCPVCRSPLLRIDIAPLNLLIYGSRFSVSA